MSLNQKCAWGQLMIFGALVVGWLVLFLAKGTIFYWQDDSMKTTFYILSGAAFVLLVLMNTWATLRGRRAEVGRLLLDL